jgi:hypothetical protein
MTTTEITKEQKQEAVINYIEAIKKARQIKDEDEFWEFLYDAENQMLDAEFSMGTLDAFIKAIL